jgi:cyclic pyranopterin phosphate synthase
MPSNLSHLDERGNARMVDVGGKDVTRREAVCRGAVFMRRETLSLMMSGGVAKGDVLAVARIAGIMAAKKTSDIIPLCHPISLTHCSVDFEVPAGTTQDLVGAREESKKQETKNDCNPAVIEIEARVRTVGQTGAEMEAMTAVAVAGLAIYDMVKGVDRGVKIGEIRLIEKSGGKSGHYMAPEITASENGVVPCAAHTVSGTGGECVNQGDERSIGEKEDGQTRPARAIPFFANSSERLLEGIRVGIITASAKGSNVVRGDVPVDPPTHGCDCN